MVVTVLMGNANVQPASLDQVALLVSMYRVVNDATKEYYIYLQTNLLIPILSLDAAFPIVFYLPYSMVN